MKRKYSLPNLPLHSETMIWKSAIAELKIGEDTKRAEADAAYEIQKQTSRKTVEIREQEADIARREKEIELQTKRS